jgi:hypothetical protein
MSCSLNDLTLCNVSSVVVCAWNTRGNDAGVGEYGHKYDNYVYTGCKLLENRHDTGCWLTWPMSNI